MVVYELKICDGRQVRFYGGSVSCRDMRRGWCWRKLGRELLRIACWGRNGEVVDGLIWHLLFGGCCGSRFAGSVE